MGKEDGFLFTGSMLRATYYVLRVIEFSRSLIGKWNFLKSERENSVKNYSICELELFAYRNFSILRNKIDQSDIQQSV